MAAAKKAAREIEVAGRTVRITSSDKLYFPAIGLTKGELVDYYLAASEAALRGISGRPLVLKRFVKGLSAPPFFQKRAPTSRPEWVETVTLSYPSGRTADEVVVRDAAQLLWCVNLGCIDLNPHAVRTDDMDHPDELRIDLDPIPGVPWAQVRDVAVIVGEVLTAHGLVGWPKTSGSRGIHVNARIAPSWGFVDVRRAALAVAREVERLAPGLATSKWWKEEREGVFLDYNQNAKDRTTCSAWSVRPVPDARVSMPMSWAEVPTCDPAEWTVYTARDRLRDVGDLAAGMDEAVGDLSALLALAEAQEAELGDAPWPPNYPKAPNEPPRVQPSRARTDGDGADAKPKGRRKPKFPLITVAESTDKAAALAGLERWKARYPDVVPLLEPADILVDTNRGRSSTWTRIRVNLRHVPAADRPAQETPDPDDAPSWGRPS